VPGGSANSVSLSSDGKVVAVGLPYNAWKGGSTRVYNFLPSSPCDDPTEIPLRISFTTDDNPEETRWELRVDAQVKQRSGSFSGYKDTTFVEEICVPATSCVTFIVYNRNGMNHPGVFALMLNGTEVARGDGDFELYDMKSIGDCSCAEDEAPFTLYLSIKNYHPSAAAAAWSILEQNTLSRYTGGAGDVLWIDECIPKSCYYLSLMPSDGHRKFDFCYYLFKIGGQQLDYDATYGGVSITTNSADNAEFCPQSYKFGQCSTKASRLECDEGSNLVQIEITLGGNPWDTYWSLVDKGAGNENLILEGGPYFVKGATIIEEVCKPANACYHFEMKGGVEEYFIYLDGKLTNSDEIGDSCPGSSAQSTTTTFAQSYGPPSGDCTNADQNVCCDMTNDGFVDARSFCIDHGCNQNICSGKPSGMPTTAMPTFSPTWLSDDQ